MLHVDDDLYGNVQIYFYSQVNDALDTKIDLKKRGIDSTMISVTGQSPTEYLESLKKEKSPKFYPEIIMDSHIRGLSGR